MNNYDDKVKNKIGAAKEVVEDSVITAKIKAEILATKGLDSLDIHVKTKNGTVTLSGKVKDVAQVELAGKVARNSNGVKEVINELSVYT